MAGVGGYGHTSHYVNVGPRGVQRMQFWVSTC